MLLHRVATTLLLPLDEEHLFAQGSGISVRGGAGRHAYAGASLTIQLQTSVARRQFVGNGWVRTSAYSWLANPVIVYSVLPGAQVRGLPRSHTGPAPWQVGPGTRVVHADQETLSPVGVGQRLEPGAVRDGVGAGRHHQHHDVGRVRRAELLQRPVCRLVQCTVGTSAPRWPGPGEVSTHQPRSGDSTRRGVIRLPGPQVLLLIFVSRQSGRTRGGEDLCDLAPDELR